MCNGTGARLHRTTVVRGEGEMPNDILILGEAPGMMEDREGLPFRLEAPAGGILRRALAELEMSPRLDNVVHCRPPENRLRNYPEAIVKCTELYLWDTIASVQPRVVLPMGALAGQYWFPGLKATEMSKLARVYIHEGQKYIIVGALHPSYVARGTDPQAWSSMLASLARAVKLAKEGF
jgi:DNA polymerase